MSERNQETILYASVIGLTLAAGAYLLTHSKPVEKPDPQYEALLFKLSQMAIERDYRQRHSKLFFDDNDEFQLESCLPELLMAKQRWEGDSDEEQERDLSVQMMVDQKYHSVVIHFGDEEVQIVGTTKITRRDLCQTSNAHENALLFVENLQKVSKAKEEKSTLTEYVKQHKGASKAGSVTTGTTDTFKEPESDSDQQEVLLNISPKKFEKPKDQLFIDFFSMYTKQFVEDKQGKQSSLKARLV